MTNELSDVALEILMTAVRISRDEQIRRVAELRSRLAQRYPSNEANIEAAIIRWANYEKRFSDLATNTSEGGADA